jgi:hypothetical protein
MKTARLIKSNRLYKPIDTEEARRAGSQTGANDARNSVMNWVRERQELRQVNPRAQFAALFRNTA